MKETPSVTSTCANCWPASWAQQQPLHQRTENRHLEPARTAASQKFSVKPNAPLRKVVPRIGGPP